MPLLIVYSVGSGVVDSKLCNFGNLKLRWRLHQSQNKSCCSLTAAAQGDAFCFVLSIPFIVLPMHSCCTIFKPIRVHFASRITRHLYTCEASNRCLTEAKQNCSKWPKMRTLMVGANEAHARLGPECAIGFVSSHMRPTYPLGVAQTPPVLGMAGLPSEPMIWDRPKSPTWRPRYAKPKGSCSPGPRYVGHRSVYPHIILGS